MESKLSTPVLFNVFNRPLETARVFQAIRNVRPQKLYISADAARADRPTEDDLCNQVREIVKSVDWECEVKYKFNSTNKGCGITINSALKWFFSEVEYGIILEDDTVPVPLFFDFCEKLLQEYKDNLGVFSINGCSLGFSSKDGDYGATRYFNMWGWATWRRSALLVEETWYNSNSISNDSAVTKYLSLPILYGNKNWVKHWYDTFNKVWLNEIDTWDYQWLYTALKNRQLIIRPNRNYITNIGFNEFGTHTMARDHSLGSLTADLDNEFKEKQYYGSLKLSDRYEIDYVAVKWRSFSPVKNSALYRFFADVLKYILIRLNIKVADKNV